MGSGLILGALALVGIDGLALLGALAMGRAGKEADAAMERLRRESKHGNKAVRCSEDVR